MGIAIIRNSVNQPLVLEKDVKQGGSTVILEAEKPVVGFTGYEIYAGWILMANNGRFSNYTDKYQCL